MIKRITATCLLSVPFAWAAEATGLHQFCETRPHVVTRNMGWQEGCDSRCYSWKGEDGQESAKMEAVTDDKIEGNISHRFNIVRGWSRWILEMNPDAHLVADLSPYKQMVLSMKSASAKKWDSFAVMIGDGKNEFREQVSSLGFVADGAWHRCVIDLASVAKAGVDIAHVKSLLMIDWGGGVDKGDQFWIDDVHFE